MACNECAGTGTKTYGSTATWHGGIGGCMMTDDVCNVCWGSGDADNPWPSHAKAERDAEVTDEYYHALSLLADRYTKTAVDQDDLLAFIAEFTEAVENRLPLMKLNRWLGYIQGVLIERGFTTVDEERDFTRPYFRHLDFP